MPHTVPTLRAQEVPISTGPLIAQASESWLVWVNTATDERLLAGSIGMGVTLTFIRYLLAKQKR
jgi:hypothetical protein